MKTTYILTIAFLLFGFQSCQDDVFDQVPTDRVSNNTITATTNNLRVALNGMHRLMYERRDGIDAQDEAGFTTIMILHDVMGEDLIFPNTGNGWFISSYRWLAHRNANDSDNAWPYRFYYRMISNANTIINNVEAAEGPQSEKDNLLGQALAYRAWAHFNLAQLYANRYVAGSANNQPAVPIRLRVANPDEPETLGVGRSSLDEVYTQVVEDIDRAITLLDGVNDNNESQIDQGVAKGIRARIALLQEDWPTAIQMAQEARTGYSLMSQAQYRAGFNDASNPEWMWGISIATDETQFFANFGAYMSRNFSSTNIRRAPKIIFTPLFNAFPSTDVRTQNFDPTGNHTALNLPSNFNRFPYTSQKFLSVDGGDSRMDVPFMRAAEMFLIEAEAKARSPLFTDAQAAQTLFQLAVARNPAYTLSTNTGAALLNEIYLHRRLELWGEGFRFLDLKRLNLPLNRTGGNHSSSVARLLSEPAGTNEWTWFIPQDEINANPGIDPSQQNP